MIDYDLETIINCFTLCAEHDDGTQWQFEISERRDDRQELIEWLEWLMETRQEMRGFNNLGFDYQVLFGIYTLQNRIKTAADIYKLAQHVIHTEYFKNPVLIPQIDLFKIHHFDNKARMTGLKMLEFVMRMDNIEEMPFPHDEPIAVEDIPRLLK